MWMDESKFSFSFNESQKELEAFQKAIDEV